MAREIRFATGDHRRPPVLDPGTPAVRVRLRDSDPARADSPDLRAARGILTSVLLGVLLWGVALAAWQLIVR